MPTGLTEILRPQLMVSITGSNPVLATIVSVMVAHRKLRYYARRVNKRYTERKESYRRLRFESPQLNLLRLCKVKSFLVKWRKG
jgi:hypothetical protein